MAKQKPAAASPAAGVLDHTPTPMPSDDEIKEALESVDGYVAPAASILSVSASKLHDKIGNSKSLQAFARDFKAGIKHQSKKSITCLRKEEALVAAHVYRCKHARVCKALNLKPSALSMWFARDEDFKKRWDEIYEDVGDDLEEVLENKALYDADTRSAFTVLRARYPQRGYRPEQKAEVNVNIGHEEILSALTKNKSGDTGSSS